MVTANLFFWEGALIGLLCCLATGEVTSSHPLIPQLLEPCLFGLLPPTSMETAAQTLSEYPAGHCTFLSATAMARLNPALPTVWEPHSPGGRPSQHTSEL